jgi:hypothetical protein
MVRRSSSAASRGLSGGLTGFADSRDVPLVQSGRDEVRVVAHGEVKPAGYDDGVGAGVAPLPLPLESEVVAVPSEDRHQRAVR